MTDISLGVKEIEREPKLKSKADLLFQFVPKVFLLLFQASFPPSKSSQSSPVQVQSSTPSNLVFFGSSVFPSFRPNPRERERGREGRGKGERRKEKYTGSYIYIRKGEARREKERKASRPLFIGKVSPSLFLSLSLPPGMITWLGLSYVSYRHSIGMLSQAGLLWLAPIQAPSQRFKGACGFSWGEP